MRKISYHDIREFLHLFWVNFTVQLRNLLEFLKVTYHYYPKLSFLRIDSYLVLSYLFTNPFAVSKKFLLQKGEKEIYAYGETPLTTLDKIAKECQISKDDTVFELGCGRGRTCFWLRSFIRCKTVGIEYIPEFITRANRVIEKFKLKKIEFRNEDILDSDYTGATVIYLYGTCFESEFIKKLIDKFRTLPSGTKIITISYPLTEYTEESIFEVMKRFPATFTWGTGDVYLQIKK